MHLVNQVTQVVPDNIHICLQLFNLWFQVSHSSVVAPKLNLGNRAEILNMDYVTK